ncbi:MAG: SPFH domain-containing protein [Candidatus Thermoplasmatota archaeon]|nr:SPFH domain-containing protein [Candidatus Thermoplasmatota archaeon]|tara:strand:- start:23835 stop:25226 length:1392 start_codon:yes stop_codon:yes gene_type:complete
MAEAGALLTIMMFATILFLVAIVIFFAQRYKRCPPDKVMVVYGRTDKGKASRTIHGGAALVWPLIQDYAFLTLTPITINIDLRNALSLQNIRINVPSTFTIGVSTEKQIMANAAERLLGLKQNDIEEMAKEIIFGQLRLTVASLTIEQINQDRDAFLELTRKNVDTELQKVGLYLINVNLVDITDESDYIESIGKKAAATAVENARVDVANAERDGAVGAAAANRTKEIEVAKNLAEAEKGRKTAEADQRVYVGQQEALAVSGENSAKAEIANSDADLAEAEASANQRAEVATAMSEAEIQKAKFTEEEERLKASEIVREQIQKQQIEIAAEAEAERQRRIARGEADAILARYEAEASGVQKVLEAKAAGYQGLVGSAGGDAKAAATLLMVEKIDQMVSAQVEAIRNLKIDSITVWDSGGDGDGSSTSNFISNLVKSLPPLHDIASNAGVDLPDYLGSMSDDD